MHDGGKVLVQHQHIWDKVYNLIPHRQREVHFTHIYSRKNKRCVMA